MRRAILAGMSLMMLAACGGSPDAVGENSAGSIKTTAVGEVVATPSPTPSAAPTTVATDAVSNAAATATDATDAAADAADNSLTSH